MTTNNFKPILFNTEMVRAILAGRKTQTRRIVKPQPSYLPYTDSKEGHEKTLKNYIDEGLKNGAIKGKYQIGDILWVRETFAKPPITAFGVPYIHKAGFDRTICGWKPSIHMPKEAARIFLKITNVRCERLQDISDNDAIGEGIDFFNHGYGGSPVGIWYKNYKFGTNNCSPNYSFQTLWDSINAKKQPWRSNPWVWVYDFERIEKPENFI